MPIVTALSTRCFYSVHPHHFSSLCPKAYSNHNTQSPEVTSKATPNNEEPNDSVRTLTEKLAEALRNISVKENLVKQHAKVAEEAVSGWEKAENEVFSLKQQLESITQKSSLVEDRAIHLDAALKECLRQLRQEREDQEQKIHKAIVKKTCEWDSTKSELQNQLLVLQSQLQSANAEAITSFDIDLRSKLEAAEKEISYLKLELLSRAEELELRTIEKDLSTDAAETASKLHLDSVKNVTKLETECRKLKVVARKASPANEHRSLTASSVYVESCTDSQSNSGEKLLVVESDTQRMSKLEPNECEPNLSDSLASALISNLPNFKNVKAPGINYMTPSLDISLMDDFLEMERFAALPETESVRFIESRTISDKFHGEDISSRAELEIMSNRTAELEKLMKMEAEKNEMEMSLTEHQDQLSTLRDCVEEAEMKLVEFQNQLAMANEAKGAAEVELEATNLKKEVVEARLEVVENELKTMLARVCSLEDEVQKERAFSGETISNCRKLEDEISRLQHETELRKAESSRELIEKQDKELAVAASKFAECQKTIASLGQQLKSLATLEDFIIDSEKPWTISRETTIT